MFTDAIDLGELHAIAAAIGMRLEWFQNHRRAPHYDLTPHRRQAALAAGAVAVTRAEAVRIWRERRETIAKLSPLLGGDSPPDGSAHLITIQAYVREA
jgi:hypothetical protein